MRGKLAPLIIIVLLTAITGVYAAPSITQFSVSPENAQAGDRITVTYNVFDSEGLGQVTTDIYVPGAINYRVSDIVQSNRFTFRETFVLPRDLSGDQTAFVRIETPDNFPIFDETAFSVGQPSRAVVEQQTDTVWTQTRVQNARAVASGSNGVAVVVDPEVPNVLQGEWIYWPITVANTRDEPVSVRLGVEGVNNWGSFRIDPTNVITVAPRSEEEAFLYIAIDDDAWTGLRYFQITTEYNGVYESKEVGMAVIAQAQDTAPWWIVWVVLVVLVIVAILVGWYLTRDDEDEEQEGGEEDDELITYY